MRKMKKKREIMFWIPYKLYELMLINIITNTSIILENNLHLLFENSIFSWFHLSSPFNISFTLVLSPFVKTTGFFIYTAVFWWSWGPQHLRSQIRCEISGSFQEILILLWSPSPYMIVHQHVLDLDSGMPMWSVLYYGTKYNEETSILLN